MRLPVVRPAPLAALLLPLAGCRSSDAIPAPPANVMVSVPPRAPRRGPVTVTVTVTVTPMLTAAAPPRQPGDAATVPLRANPLPCPSRLCACARSCYRFPDGSVADGVPMTNTPDNAVIGAPLTLDDGGVWQAAQIAIGVSANGTATPGTLVIAASAAGKPTTLEVSGGIQVGQDGTAPGAAAGGTLDVTGGSEVSAAGLAIAAGATIAVDAASGIVLGSFSLTPSSLVVGPGAVLDGVSGTVIADVVLAGRLAVLPPAVAGSDPGGALFLDGPLTGTGTISVGASLAPGGMLEIANAIAFTGTIGLAPGATLALMMGDAPGAALAMAGATVDLRGDPFGNGQTLGYDSATGLLTISSAVSSPTELPETAVLDVGTGYVAGDFAVRSDSSGEMGVPGTLITMPQTVRAAPTGATQPGTGGTTQPGAGGATQPGTGGATQPGTGGATQPGTGGTTQPGTGGATQPGTGGTTQPGTGGTTQPGTGGTTQPGTGGTTQPGTGGTTQPGTGGATQPGTGGTTQPGTGGGSVSGTGGTGGTVPSTGPAPTTQGGATGNTVQGVACFAAGTAILTPRGPVPVERLAIGEPVVTRARAGCLAAPIRWIGCRRLDLRGHPDPAAVQPVCIRQGAVAPGVPVRDLLLSPDHAVFLGGILIPVKYLVNGRSIVQERRRSFILYLHIELDRHDVVLAEALPVETYLDTGNRRTFAPAAGPVALHPDVAPRSWERDACAPLTGGGAVVAAVRRQLALRAAPGDRRAAARPADRGPFPSAAPSRRAAG